MSDVEAAVAAIRAGRLAIVPTDTVYGLAASAYSEGPVRRLYRAKGRERDPADGARRRDRRHAAGVRARAARTRGADRAGAPAGAAHARPAEPRATLSLARGRTARTRSASASRCSRERRTSSCPVSASIVATSANLPGGPDPATIDEVPEEIRAAADAIVDVGPLPGTPSTVIDFTGPEPVVLREGAVSTDEALRLVGSVL